MDVSLSTGRTMRLLKSLQAVWLTGLFLFHPCCVQFASFPSFLTSLLCQCRIIFNLIRVLVSDTKYEGGGGIFVNASLGGKKGMHGFQLCGLWKIEITKGKGGLGGDGV